MENYHHFYGMRLRGISPGTFPKQGFVEFFQCKSATYYDILEYDRQLTHDEVKQYELDYLFVKEVR